MLADLEVEVALLWTDAAKAVTAGFVNGEPISKGAHVRGVVAGIRRVYRKLARERLAGVQRAALDEATERGRVALVHVVTPFPCLHGCLRNELDSPDIADAVRILVGAGLSSAVTRAPTLRPVLLSRLPA